MADTSIYANYLRPVKSVADYDADYQTKQANAFTLEKAGLESNALRQAVADDQATRQAYMGGGDLDAVLKRLTGGGQYKAAQALQKQIADQAKATADVGKVRADTAKTEMETRAKRIDTVGSAMGYLRQNPTLENAKMLNDWMVQQGLSTPEQGAKDWADIQASPDKIAQFADLGFRAALNAKEQLPKLQNVNAGGYMLNQAVDPLTGKATETGRDMVTESEAQRLARERQAADAAAGRAVTVRGQNMTDARARERMDYDRSVGVADAGGPSQTEFAKIFGKAQPGYRWKADGSLEAIPGGPADIKAGEKGQKDLARAQGAVDTANRVMETIDDAIGKTGIFTAGVGGVTSVLPATPARNLQGALDTIKSNIGFDKLQAMREASPTGGALGQVAVKELDMLQASIASLDQYQSPAQLRANLNKVNTHYTNWKDAVKKANSGVTDARPQAPSQPGGVPADIQNLLNKHGGKR